MRELDGPREGDGQWWRGFRRCAVPSAWLALCAAVGCSGPDEATPAATVTDSADVRVVTYDLVGVDVPTYRTVAEHDLQIGVQEGAPEYSFSSIPDIAMAPDGSLVVSDELARELRVYDPQGMFLNRIGRSGEGPGEFGSAPTIVGFAADTIFALDRRNSRLTSFLMNGDVRSMTTLGREGAGRPVFMIRQDDGSFLSQSPWVNPEMDRTAHDLRLELDSAVIERLDAGGAPIDTLLVLPDRNRVRMSQLAAGGRFRTQEATPPFGARAFLRSDGVRPIVGRSDSFELQLLGPGGAPETVLRVLGVQNPMTGDEMKRRQLEAIRAEYGEEGNALLQRLNVEFIPDRLQAFQTIVVSEDGGFWVALTEYDGWESGYDWLVFDADGGLRGRVTTPPGLSVSEVHRDFLVGVFRDEFDVSYVRRYPLVAGGSSGGTGPSAVPSGHGVHNRGHASSKGVLLPRSRGHRDDQRASHGAACPLAGRLLVGGRPLPPVRHPTDRGRTR